MKSNFIDVSECLPDIVDEKFVKGLGVVKQSKCCVIRTKSTLQIGFYREVFENGEWVRDWWLRSKPTSELDNDGKKVFNVEKWMYAV